MNATQRKAHLILHRQTLLDEWKKRLKLRAEGGKLRAEGDKLYAEGGKLRAEGGKLYAEGDKLYAEGGKLYAEGDRIFACAVIDEFGPRTLMGWDSDGNCTLGNGEVYLVNE